MFYKSKTLVMQLLKRYETFATYNVHKKKYKEQINSGSNSQNSHMQWGVYQKKQYQIHFSSKIQNLQKEVAEYIQKIGQKEIDSSVFTDIGKYLSAKQYQNFEEASSYSKINLLVAISIRGVSPLIRNPFNKQLIQHISRHEYDVEIEDQTTLQVLLKQFERYMKLHPSKAKLQSLRNYIMILVKLNFDKLALKNYPLLVSDLTYNLMNNAASYFKYLSIVDLIQQRLSTVFHAILTTNRQKQEYNCILQPQFLVNLSNLYKIYRFKNKRVLQVYYEFVTQRLLVVNHLNGWDFFHLFNVIYRNFPYNLYNQKNQQYKTLLLQKYINFLESQKALQQILMDANKGGPHLLFSIITHYLSLQLKRTPTKFHNGLQYISADQSIKPVALPQVFWKIYQQKPHLSDDYSILDNSIKTCYPEKYIDTKTVFKPKRAPLIQSQTKIRISQCLQQMQIPYESQYQTLGRYIDFKLQDNILLQIDGLIHFSPRDFEHLDNTFYRNMHILNGGYRLITISIYEYNIYREKEQLKKLIKAKYDLIKEQNAIFVL